MKLKLRNPQVPERCDAQIQISFTLTSTQLAECDDDYDNASGLYIYVRVIKYLLRAIIIY